MKTEKLKSMLDFSRPGWHPTAEETDILASLRELRKKVLESATRGILHIVRQNIVMDSVYKIYGRSRTDLTIYDNDD